MKTTILESVFVNTNAALLDPRRRVRALTVDAMLKRCEMYRFFTFDKSAVQRNDVKFICEQARTFMANADHIVFVGVIQRFLNLVELQTRITEIQNNFKLYGNVEHFRREVKDARRQYLDANYASTQNVFGNVMKGDIFSGI